MDPNNKKEFMQLFSRLVDLLSEDEKQVILGRLSEEKGIPVSIFRSGISGLEALTLFLKDVKKESIGSIASKLNRAPSTLYTTYENAKSKLTQELDISDFSTSIPVEIFSDRNFSILESLVAHLKDTQGLNLAMIAELLDKSYSTVKTVYRRYRKKCQ